VQSKGNGSQAGNRIGTGIFTAGVEMRSNRYCDVNGNNCFGPGEVGTGGGSGNVNVTDHYLTIRGPETGNKEQVIGRHDFCSISQNMTFDNGGASGGPEEGCRVWQQGGGEWKLRARRNGSASSNTATMCGATCFTLDNSNNNNSSNLAPCSSMVWSQMNPRTLLPNAQHGTVVDGGTDSSYPVAGMYQCSNGSWQEVRPPIQDRNM